MQVGIPGRARTEIQSETESHFAGLSGDLIRLEIRGVDQLRRIAMKQGDIGALSRILHPDLKYVHSDGSSDSKASYLEGVSSRKWIYKTIDVVEEQISIDREMARFIGTIHIEVVRAGWLSSIDCGFTAEWVLESGEWQMRSWHSIPMNSMNEGGRTDEKTS